MEINIAICDDERAEITYLTALVQKWAEARDIAARISDYDSAESFLSAYQNKKTADILLLDIQMKKMDGVALAKQIRAADKAIQIIFITGYTEYIADGYDVEALHYLLKPVMAEKLASVLDRAMEKLEHNQRALFISSAGENTRIPLYEIRYLEVVHNYVTIHAAEKHTIKKSLGEFEKELDKNFFRIGRSFIINLKYIRKVTKTEVLLSDGAVIPLPRVSYEALNRAVIERL